MKIWCVEDDASIREIILYTLASTGFEAEGFGDGEAFFAALASLKPDLILLDVMLPGMDGVEILRRLKADPAARGIPVIMATAKGMEMDKVKSLDLGADDYLVKPFGMLEMVSRVKAVMRRCAPASAPDVLRIDGLELNAGEHTVTVNGARVELTYKEYELLKLFMSNPRFAFTREQLLDKVWGMDYFGDTRTVDVHIQTLRQKLGTEGKLIRTVRGVGYRLEAEK